MPIAPPLIQQNGNDQQDIGAGDLTRDYTEVKFRGADDFTVPRDLAPGLGQVADDCVIGGPAQQLIYPGVAPVPSGGNLETRQSYAGQLTALTGHPLYELITWLRSNGTTTSLVASNGGLFTWDFGATALVSVTITGATGAIVQANAYATKFGGYIYIVDGFNPLLRMSVDGSTATTLLALTAPTTSPVITLTNLLIGANNLAASWTFDQFTAPTSLGDLPGTSGTFGSSSNDFTGWTTVGSVDTHQPVSGSSLWYVRLDDAPSYLYLAAQITNNGITNSDITGGTGLINRFAQHFQFTATYYTDVNGAQDGVVCEVTVYDASHAAIGNPKSFLWEPGITLNTTSITHVFDFSDIPATSISYYKISRLGPGPNTRPGGNGPYLSNIHLQPYVASYYSTSSVSSVGVSDGTGAVAGDIQVQLPDALGSVNNIIPLPEETVNWFLGGFRFSLDLGSSLSFTGYSVLAFPINLTVLPVAIRAVLTFRSSKTDPGVNSDTVQYLTDASGQTILFVDISLIASSLTSIRYVDLAFLSDVQLTAPLTGTTNPAGRIPNGPPTTRALAFSLGQLTSAGNLSIGYAPYQWIVTDSTNVWYNPADVDSDVSPTSLAVTPSLLLAEAQVVPPPVPTPDIGVALYQQYWRGGGVESDGLYRLVATVLITSTVAYGADTITYGAGSGNPYIAWNGTTLTDNTPDGFLLTAPTLVFGKQGPPPAPTRVSTYGDTRLVLVGGGAQQNTVYGSWLITASSGTVYWTLDLNLDPSIDASAAEKGFFFQVGGAGNNIPVQQFVPSGTQALMFKENTIYLLSGDDPTNITQRELKQENAVGLLAPRAVAVFDNSVWFLALDGVYRTDGDTVVPASYAIQNAINPSLNGATALNPAAYAKSAFFVADQRLHLLVPTTPSDTGPTQILVYDRRTAAWTRWTLGPFAGFTTGVVFGSQANTSNLILAAVDGQIVYVTGYTGDKLIPSSTPVAVTMKFVSRAYGQQEAAYSFFTVDRPKRFWVDAIVNETATLTVTITGDTPAAAYTFTIPLSAAAPYQNFSRLKNCSQGRNVTVTLSLPTKTKSTIRGFLMRTVQGRSRN